jgi:GST-like protein
MDMKSREMDVVVSLGRVMLSAMTNTQSAPIELFTHGTPNGHKVAIALEELGFPYEVRVVDVFAGAGQTPEFLALNPAGRIPVIRDRANGVVLTESDAILLYLADKAGRLVPPSGAARTRAIELLFLQASLQGPMFGQRMHFSFFGPETVPYGIRRYEEQGDVVDGIVDRLLEGKPYLLGDDYSIVDVAFYPWYFAARHAAFGFEHRKNLHAWFERVAARPAVRRGVTVPSGLRQLPPRRRA